MRVYDWCANAAIGEHIVYWRGGTGEMPPEVQSSAYEASRRGYVFLAQRRRIGGGFDYEATRISRRTALHLGLIEDRTCLRLVA